MDKLFEDCMQRLGSELQKDSRKKSVILSRQNKRIITPKMIDQTDQLSLDKQDTLLSIE